MNAWEEVTSFTNLCRAAKRAARCKRRVAGAARFLERLEPQALALQRELVGDTWRPGRAVTFVIRDPKLRTITAAPFRDRVVHHALIDPLEPELDAALVPESFACRRGKGTHKALEHAREMVRRHSHFLKLDIAKCFESIGHGLVLDTLEGLGLSPEILHPLGAPDRSHRRPALRRSLALGRRAPVARRHAGLRAAQLRGAGRSRTRTGGGILRLRQPRQPRRQLQRRRLERALGEPQQRHGGEPEQQPGPPPRQGVAAPDRAGPARAPRP